ncbi:nose resistant to fluoxetine protein 6, partial [Trichonephila clavata]
ELYSLTNLTVTSPQHAPKKLTDEAIFMIFIISIFLILAAIGTTITAYDNYYEPHKKRRRSSDGEFDHKTPINSHREKTLIENSGGKKGFSEELYYIKLKPFFNCFCIYTNGKRILSTVSNDGEFVWLHGIRIIGNIWITAIHVGLFYFNSLSDASVFKLWRNYWLTPLFLNGTCVISLFFVLSGFLNGYFTSLDYFKKRGTISWLRFYRKRLLRIAPLYAMILGCYSILFPYMGSGPVWPAYGTNPVFKKSWWSNLIFLNNFQSSWIQCYNPAWYMAADMQLLLISPIFPISLFKVWNFVDIIYIKPVSNLGAYLIGFGLGHYLWKREMCKKGRNDMITLCCGWIGFAICFQICFNVLYFSKETLLKRIAFNGFSDFFFSCCVAWIIYVCATKQGGFVSRLLSLKIFLPLSRLAFAAYLINCIVILHYFFSSTKPADPFSISFLIGIILYVTVCTYVISFIASLFVEFPMSRLLR